MPITPIAVRLTRGTDLKQAIAKLVQQHQLSAGTVASCVGCLSTLHIRLANAEHRLLRQEAFEIVSLMGTLTPAHQHLHIAVADAEGKVWGGHLLEGCVVATTAELIIHQYSELAFTREFDSSTGYSELVVKKKRPK
ncbi:PPC domain-containing DNA-binding protein [Vibrio hangzhouensis]|uniref:PPC domain-containing protein n=1 Tax=Vibrio hangzhouensis TaxID=462991 RepID=A0A1H5ZSE6_9VIBR|nr:PPC domain-containing DNA-binding protein [Vibrio hangzhouensis]SEG38326.1 hypothetical protein SAMN04488244_112115 [Vibrio hangzhouensis]